ncbi:MAG: hypothetical protein LAO24_02415 [Acidobacteriia bacterium]|nr:hypothetical protein [Terriglobia bacterium]
MAFKLVIASGLIALANTVFAQETAQQVSRTGSFDLACSADTAFPLFSPEGELEWVKGWAPTPVFPSRIEFKRDTVFREGHDGEEAVWTIVDADWQFHRAEYVRLAPHSHTGRIVVKVEPLGAERSKVVVSYTVTAFGEHAGSLMAAFSEEAYAAKMRDWQQRISAYLEGRKLRVMGPSAAPQTEKVR